MGDKYKDKGHHGGAVKDIANFFTRTEDRHVENTDTGEKFIVTKRDGQTVGEAIKKGQIRKDNC